MSTIFVTPFDPKTKQVTADSNDSGFETLGDVELMNGEPLNRGKRTLTYKDTFYSNYSVTGLGS